jgi:type II secretory pathway pseudopilin PulG
VEVLVAAAIVAIISVMLVFAFYTMANVGRRASDITSADEELSEDIALDETAHKDAVSGELEFTINGKPFKLPSMFNTYTTEDGRSFSTFEYGGG